MPKKVTKKQADLEVGNILNFSQYSKLDFDNLNKRALDFANHLKNNFETITDILLEYESYEVVEDEFQRTQDILTNLNENKDYFVLRTGSVTSFLPRNQPLYALTCFVLVPSLMATDVYFRIPHSMRSFFPRLLEVLNLSNFFPNVFVSKSERTQFLEERSALLINPTTEESRPVTETVIFTGTSTHAERLRLIFDQRTLFITNGSGHNPVVVSDDANIDKSIEACLTLQLYNQGQDCAAPNAILVHSKVYDIFLKKLRNELTKVKVGPYHNKENRVGPISDPDDLVRIQSLIVENIEWLDSSTKGVIKTAEVIVEPTIICKPLSAGGNFTEVFAPLIFIQKYEKDELLEKYFEDKRYPRNAMYITVYGTSNYLESFLNKKFSNKILHDESTFLRNYHLHDLGVERGVKPYGGFGYAASNLSIHGKIFSKPTLPQRDIYENLVVPLLEEGEKIIADKIKSYEKMSKNLYKDIRKILGMKILSQSDESQSSREEHGKSYFDALDIIASDSQRYIEFTPEKTFKLLAYQNAEFIGTMQPKRIHQVRSLVQQLKNGIQQSELHQFLYELPKIPDASKNMNKQEQLDFFRNIYQLLFAADSGPRLSYFLLDADKEKLFELLNV